MPETPARIHRWIQRYVGISHSHPWWTLCVYGVITLVAAGLGSQLRIRTDLRLLLPSNVPSVRALELSEKRMGSTDFFTIAFEDSSLQKVARFQKAMAESLSEWKQSQWVQYDEDRTYFQRHVLLYLPADQLRDLAARLHAMSRGAVSFNPLSMDLGDEPTAPPTLEGWPDRLSLYKQGIPMDLVQGLFHQVELETGSRQIDSGTTKSDSRSLPDSLQDRMIGWQAEKGVWVGVVIAQLRIPSTEGAFAQVAKDQGDRLGQAVQAALGIHIRTSVVGAYRDPSTEISEITDDIWISSTISLVLILGLLLIYMRRPGNVLVVFLPLIAAMIWMMAAAEIVYGRLTVLTSFVLALLSGLGVEYSIHIYSRWVEERRDGLAPDHAMTASLSRTGRSLFSAMAASIACMLAMQVGHFQGFKEFGVVLSMGIFLAFVSSVLLLPPLLFALLEIGNWVAAKGWRAISWLIPTQEATEGAILLPRFTWSKSVQRIAFISAMLVTIAMLVAPHVGFENDFANLRAGVGKFEWISAHLKTWTGTSKPAEDGISYGRAVGAGRNTSPSLVLGSSEAQMRIVHDTLGARFGSARDTMLKSFVTIRSFVPDSSDQVARLAVLKRIRIQLDSGFPKASRDQKSKLAALKRYTETTLITFDSLPPYARHFLTESDGSHGKFGFLYGELRESDAVESRKFQDRYGSLHTELGDVPVASSGFIYADVVATVKGDIGRLAVAVFVLLGLVVSLDTRSWRGFTINMGYILLIAIWTWGAMGWLGLKLGIFNIVVLPALLSNTVDATIHLYHRRMEAGAGKLGEIYNTAGSSVLAGTLTNAFGFLALVFVAHQGLNSIGILASLGYAAGIVLMFTAMPLLLELLCPTLPEEGHSED